MPSHLDTAEDVDFITRTAIERDPKKRRVKPVETQASILDFDLGESSDDSDFRIEDHPDASDDDSMNSDGEGLANSSGESGLEDSDDSDIDSFKKIKLPNSELSIADVIQQATKQDSLRQLTEKDAQVYICCGCLGDQSDGTNEIVECDSCGVTVHEACYGVSDSVSLSSTDSLSPTAPWFCETCKAGVSNPVCELCPNSGGIFKETDVGKWVHLVCALYVPGVAFGEVDKLSSVTLFEMQYSKWGAKTCGLCVDERFARTGVCIGCDAGMCRNYFHVTCAQREGFLSEAHSEECDQADPFYAHCKLHSDKTLVKRRKRNYLALQLRTHFRKIQFEQAGHSETPEQVRIQRKLNKQKVHYMSLKGLKQPPWVPTQKMPRLLTTSASACRKLLAKAQLMGIDTSALEMQEAQTAALIDIRKKWHISPAFTVEFIAYYLDRNDRLRDMKDSLKSLLDNNQVLLEEQQFLRTKYDKLFAESSEEQRTNLSLKQSIQKFHSAIMSACPSKRLPNVDDIGKPAAAVVARQLPQPMMVPTAAALKMGVGFPLNNIPSGRNDAGRVLSSHARQTADSLLLNECGICRQHRDQHLLAKCDTCHLYYHLNCLNPPLTRLPKKSKLYGWQCSECDKTSDDSDLEETKSRSKLNTSMSTSAGTRRSRGRYSREQVRSGEAAVVTVEQMEPVVVVKGEGGSPIRPKQKVPSPLISPSRTLPPLKPKLPPSKTSSPITTTITPILKIKPLLEDLITTTPPPLAIIKASSPAVTKVTTTATVKPPAVKPLVEPIVIDDQEDDYDLAIVPAVVTSKVVTPEVEVRGVESVDGVEAPVSVTLSMRNYTTTSVDSVGEQMGEDGNSATEQLHSTLDDNGLNSGVIGNGDQYHSSKSKKRRREKHRNRYSPDQNSPVKEHKRKRKKKSLDIENPNPHPRITIKIKSIPLPAGEVASVTNPQCFYVNNESNDPFPVSNLTAAPPCTSPEPTLHTVLEEVDSPPLVTTRTPLITAVALSTLQHQPAPRPARTVGMGAGGKGAVGEPSICDVCKEVGANVNLVRCDECQKNYHFTCLDPPLKKTPKKRGYSWHCADCDPTASE